MEIYIKNAYTGRIVKSTEKALKMLGGNFYRVNPPADALKETPVKEAVKEAPVKEAPVKEAPVQAAKEELLETKAEYVEAVKALNAEKGLGLKGIHLYSVEKLKEIYEGNK